MALRYTKEDDKRFTESFDRLITEMGAAATEFEGTGIWRVQWRKSSP